MNKLEITKEMVLAAFKLAGFPEGTIKYITSLHQALDTRDKTIAIQQQAIDILLEVNKGQAMGLELYEDAEKLRIKQEEVLKKSHETNKLITAFNKSQAGIKVINAQTGGYTIMPAQEFSGYTEINKQEAQS